MMADRFDPANRALAQFCTQAIHAWKNKQYAIEENGEASLLKRLRPFAPKLMLDVGANVGEWATAACRDLPDVVVHAFEIAPRTAAILARNCAPFSDRIVINVFGLGDVDSTVTLFTAASDSTIASTVRDAIAYSVGGEGVAQIEAVEVPVIRGDAYLQRHDIDHVDMLKIDVEGADFRVLQGFADAFACGAIDLVQFEYGPLNLTTRTFLADFYEFFARQGYVLGKLFPEGVAFKPTGLDDEDFVGPNYVACRTARSDLIEALRCPPLRLAT